MIGALETLLQEARNGELIAFAGACVYTGQGMGSVTANTDVDVPAVIGELRLLSHSIELDFLRAHGYAD